MTELKTLIKMIKQEYFVLTQEQKSASVLLFIVVSVGSIMEFLGVSAILPFIQSIINIDEFRENKYIKTFISAFAIENNTTIIFLMLFLSY